MRWSGRVQLDLRFRIEDRVDFAADIHVTDSHVTDSYDTESFVTGIVVVREVVIVIVIVIEIVIEIVIVIVGRFEFDRRRIVVAGRCRRRCRCRSREGPLEFRQCGPIRIMIVSTRIAHPVAHVVTPAEASSNDIGSASSNPTSRTSLRNL